MIYRFVVVSNEVNNFHRDIIIDSNATFFQLHEIILSSVNYAKDQLTSFFVCNEDWSRKTEITLIDMESNFGKNIYTMSSCQLSKFLNEEKQKLIYVFDQLNDRCFFIELNEIILDRNQDYPRIIKFAGNPPKQVIQIEDMDFFNFPLDDNKNNHICFDSEFEIGNYNDEDFENLSEDKCF